MSSLPVTPLPASVPLPLREERENGYDIDERLRKGTISSARFNLLSSMVGGGSLSLPLAFHQAGNALIGPLLLLATAIAAEQSVRFLVRAGIYSTSPGVATTAPSARKGTSSYENAASQAFGPKARVFSMALVSVSCFFGTVGYAVLLRDMLEPLVDSVATPHEGTGSGPTPARNAAMISVVLLITPLCTMRNLTALRNVGAASMASVLTVGLLVAYRSIQCQLGYGSASGHADGISDGANGADEPTVNPLRAFPTSAKELLDAIPLFISAFICHFNVLPIHNELRNPTPDRVRRWIRTSIWPAAFFYCFIGFFGSIYVKCTPSGSVQGNILLDFEEDDPLLLVGRLCLALTITLAFPMLVVPARDILLRSMKGTRLRKLLGSPNTRCQTHPFAIDTDFGDISITSAAPEELTTVDFEPMEISPNVNLAEPLLSSENPYAILGDPGIGEEISLTSIIQDNHSIASTGDMVSVVSVGDDDGGRLARTFAAIVIFWSAASVACMVTSIDVVWDLLGSSFSIMLAWLIPCSAYLKLSRSKRYDGITDGGSGYRKWLLSRAIAWISMIFFTPLMLVSTANAIYNTVHGS